MLEPFLPQHLALEVEGHQSVAGEVGDDPLAVGAGCGLGGRGVAVRVGRVRIALEGAAPTLLTRATVERHHHVGVLAAGAGDHEQITLDARRRVPARDARLPEHVLVGPEVGRYGCALGDAAAIRPPELRPIALGDGGRGEGDGREDQTGTVGERLHEELGWAGEEVSVG